MVRVEGNVVVIEAPALQQAEAITEADALVLQQDDAQAVFGGQPLQRYLHPALTTRTGKDAHAFAALPAQGFQRL